MGSWTAMGRVFIGLLICKAGHAETKRRYIPDYFPIHFLTFVQSHLASFSQTKPQLLH